MSTAWLTLFAAFGAAILTVVGSRAVESIYEWLIRPKIEIAIDRAKEVPWLFSAEAGDRQQPKWPAHWIHLVVTNRGRTAAIGTQILAVQLLQKQKSDAFEFMPKFLPMCLQWSHSGEPPKVEMDVLHDFSRRVNLAHVERPGIERWQAAGCPANRVVRDVKYNVDDSDEPASVVLCTEVSPSNECNLLGPGEYELHLVVGAKNCKAKTVRVGISYTGKWEDDAGEFARNGLLVKLLSG
jgi:hypothetical protein